MAPCSEMIGNEGIVWYLWFGSQIWQMQIAYWEEPFIFHLITEMAVWTPDDRLRFNEWTVHPYFAEGTWWNHWPLSLTICRKMMRPTENIFHIVPVETWLWICQCHVRPEGPPYYIIWSLIKAESIRLQVAARFRHHNQLSHWYLLHVPSCSWNPVTSF